jgi:hypothetical protein
MDDKVHDETRGDPLSRIEEVTRYLPGLYLLFAAEREGFAVSRIKTSGVVSK